MIKKTFPFSTPFFNKPFKVASLTGDDLKEPFGKRNVKCWPHFFLDRLKDTLIEALSIAFIH